MVTNRYGLTFRRNTSRKTYANSGNLWRTYYRWVCTRCSWWFASGKHMNHRLADCDEILSDPFLRRT